MNIRYRTVPNLLHPEGHVKMPLLQVVLRYNEQARLVLALVDSGSVECIFPESLGTVLGIDVPSGEPRSFYGLANQEAIGFMHPVQLQVTGFDYPVEIKAGFVPGNIVPLLGQSGFFEKYQVVFERFNRSFQVYTKTDALIRNRIGHGHGRKKSKRH
jgi:hypothetical protein